MPRLLKLLKNPKLWLVFFLLMFIGWIVADIVYLAPYPRRQKPSLIRPMPLQLECNLSGWWNPGHVGLFEGRYQWTVIFVRTCFL